jgi:hypothetical protein
VVLRVELGCRELRKLIRAYSSIRVIDRTDRTDRQNRQTDRGGGHARKHP